MTRVVTLVDDLMDRSRITAVASDTVAARSVEATRGADVVVLDLGRHAGELELVRERAPGAFIVAFGRHDDTAALETARASGADRVLTRARFFADVASAIDRSADERPSDP
jgi:DNA-binding NarL/FixJ family response regulator